MATSSVTSPSCVRDNSFRCGGYLGVGGWKVGTWVGGWVGGWKSWVCDEIMLDMMGGGRQPDVISFYVVLFCFSCLFLFLLFFYYFSLVSL